MKIEMREEKFVMGLYFVSFLCLLLTVMDNVPLLGVLMRQVLAGMRYLNLIWSDMQLRRTSQL